MCEIVEELQRYVPSRPCQLKRPLPNGEFYSVDEQAVHQILSGGDQLTCCRCRGAQSLRCNHESTLERLEGLIPITEDWHARLTLVKVSACIALLLIIVIGF